MLADPLLTVAIHCALRAAVPGGSLVADRLSKKVVADAKSNPAGAAKLGRSLAGV